MAVPVAVGVALFIAYYAPRRLAQGLGYVVDLLAAVPSVVYGLWGLIYLVPHLIPLSEWLANYFGWIPILNTEGGFGKSVFAASLVLAVMILPIIAAISREIFLQVPQTQREAALALGATRWEMIRMSVLPYSRSGVASATVLGFGRALGETIAVALVLSSNFEIVWKIFDVATCIGCGACVAACPNGSASLFLGAKITHLGELPQGQAERWTRVVDMTAQHDAEGFGGCTNIGECTAACPKEIPLDVISQLNHDLRTALIKGH